MKIESFYTRDGAPGLRSDVQFAHTIRQSCNLESLPVPPVHLRLVHFHQYRRGPSHPARTFFPISDIVTHIQLSDVRCSHIWSFLSPFPRLQHLELEAVGPSEDPESSLPLDGIFDGTPLSTMRLATASMGHIICDLIKVAGSLSHLHDFGVEYQDVRQRELPRLADAIQKRVECLRFSASCHPGYGVHDQWRPSAFDICEQTNSASDNPKTDSLGVRQGSRISLADFVQLKPSSWITSELTVPVAIVIPTCPLNGSQRYYSSFPRQSKDWCSR